MASDASAALAARKKVQMLLNSARTGNLDLFKRIAEQMDEGGSGVARTVADVKDANNRGALHFAAREGRVDVCKFLVDELKLDVDVRDDDGETPLIHASRQGHFVVAKYLVDHGAIPSVASELGATPLHHAAGIGNAKLLNYFLSLGVDIESQSDAGTPLIWAAGHGQENTTKILLEHKANPNAETDDNITPLLSSVAAASLPCLELLIEAGANPNGSAGGATPLHVAADNGNRKIIECLLKAGADPNSQDEDGLKPIQIAALRNNCEAVEVLFPLTSPIESITNWSIDGIIDHMETESKKQVDSEEPSMSNNPSIKKPETIEVTPEAKKKSWRQNQEGMRPSGRRTISMQ